MRGFRADRATLILLTLGLLLIFFALFIAQVDNLHIQRVSPFSSSEANSREGHATGSPALDSVTPDEEEPETSRKTAPRSLIAGRVLNRLDRSPVPATAVRAVQLDGGGSFEAATDRNGDFVLPRVPGSFEIRCSREGFLAGKPLRLDFKLMEEIPEILLRPSAAILGRVLGRGDRPVPNASVRVFQPAGFPPEIEINLAGRTADDGGFSFSALPQGLPLMLVVEEAGFSREDRPFLLRRSLEQLEIRLKASSRVEGLVRTRSGNPVDGVIVRAAGIDPEGHSDRGGIVRSGPKGYFMIDGLGAGPYRILASATWTSPFGELAVETVVLKSGERKSGVVLTVPDPLELEGFVKNLKGDGIENVGVEVANSGNILDQAVSGPGGQFRLRIPSPPRKMFLVIARGIHDGFRTRIVPLLHEFKRPLEIVLEEAPLGNLTVRCLRLSGWGIKLVRQDPFLAGLFLSPEAEETEISSEEVEYPGLEAGTYWVQAWTSMGSVSAGQEVQVPSGGSAVLDLPCVGEGILRGRVLDDVKRIGIFGASVAVERVADGMILARVKSSNEGRFEIPALPPGEVLVRALAPGLAQTADVRVFLPAKGPLEILLTEAGQITALTSEKISMCQLERRGDGASRSFVPDSPSPGIFLFEDLPPSHYRLAAGGRERFFSLSPGETLTFDLRGTEESICHGKLILPGGQPISDLLGLAALSLQVPGKVVLGQVGLAGKFRIEGLDAGNYVLLGLSGDAPALVAGRVWVRGSGDDETIVQVEDCSLKLRNVSSDRHYSISLGLKSVEGISLEEFFPGGPPIAFYFLRPGENVEKGLLPSGLYVLSIQGESQSEEKEVRIAGKGLEVVLGEDQ